MLSYPVQISDLLDNLNEQQREAVTTIFGPVLVIAGPGTGKTQVLASRIAYILEHPDVQASPGQILCLTFTESGVKAMRERLVKLIGQQAAYKVQVHTFHSFCNKIIQDYPDKFPRFSANPRQISDLEKLKLMKTILEELDPEKSWQLRPAGSNKGVHAHKILSAIQLLKREGIEPAKLKLIVHDELTALEQNPKLNKKGEPTRDYQSAVKSQQKNTELAQIYEEYEKSLEKQNLYDYEDMILQVVERLHKDEDLAYEILEKYQFILVDEYQDTNGAQNQILQILGKLDPESEPNIFAVGDDDQAIYRFQGANVENILFFKKEFPTAKLIVLTTNYRSAQPILDMVAGSIQHNTQRLSAIYTELDKHLTAANEVESAVKPSVVTFKHSDEEVAWIVRQIQELQKAGESLSDIAVIYRNHADVLLLRQLLEKLNIAHRLKDGTNLLEEPIVLNILQFLNVVAYSELDRDHHLAQLLLQGFVQKQFGLEPTEIFSFLTLARDQNKFGNPTYPIKAFVDLALGLEEENGVRRFVESVIKWQQNFSNMPLSEALVVMLAESGLIDRATSNAAHPEQWEAVNSFVRFVRELTLANNGHSLQVFLEDLKVYKEENIKVGFNAPSVDDEAVHLLTAHSAKGLEFKHVYIFKLVEKHWSNKLARNFFKWPEDLFAGDNDNFTIEEERRLFFVAATRAKQSLHLSYASVYQDSSGESDKQPSVFVGELDENTVQQVTFEGEEDENRVFWQQMLRPKLVVDGKDEATENAYLKGLVADMRLSASNLNTYLDCPLRFKYECLFKIPTVPTPELALGNALHRVLELQYKRLMQDEKDIDLERAKQDFAYALQQQLLSRQDYDLTFTEGKKLLDGYYAEYKDTMRPPAAVEYNFGRHNILFDLPNQEPVILAGKIDKLEWLDKKENTVRLVDYKTKQPLSENAIKGITKANNQSIWWQLVFYKVLSDLDEQFRPNGKMNKFKIEQFRIDFLKPDSTTKQLKQVDLEVTDQDVAELRQVIGETMLAIRNLEFSGTDEHPLCGECEYCKLAQGAASA